jgi:hypothetical protein
MSEKSSTEKSDKGKKSFWTTLPGVLAAFATLLTAIGSLLVVLHQIDIIPPPSPPTPPEKPPPSATLNANPEILEDFTKKEDAEKWRAEGGTIEWINDAPKNYDARCSGCENPYNGGRGKFIHWIKGKKNHYAYYVAPDSFTSQLSGDYVGGTLEYWLLHDRTISTADWAPGKADRWDVILGHSPLGAGGDRLYFIATISPNQEWQRLSFELSNNKYTYPNCWIDSSKTERCAAEAKILEVLDEDQVELKIRAEYWSGGDTSFLDDVKIMTPNR